MLISRQSPASKQLPEEPGSCREVEIDKEPVPGFLRGLMQPHLKMMSGTKSHLTG